MTNPFAASVQTWGLIIQTVVLTVTAGLVWWYASETQQMKKEMVHQTQLNLRLFIEPVIWADMGNHKPRIKLKNIGSGVALNIMVEPLVMTHDNGRYWRHEFEGITALATGQEEEVKYDFYSQRRPLPHPSGEATADEMETEPPLANPLVQIFSHPNAYLDPFPIMGAPRTLTIVFQDAEGGAYQLKACVYPRVKSNRERQVKLGCIESIERPSLSSLKLE